MKSQRRKPTIDYVGSKVRSIQFLASDPKDDSNEIPLFAIGSYDSGDDYLSVCQYDSPSMEEVELEAEFRNSRSFKDDLPMENEIRELEKISTLGSVSALFSHKSILLSGSSEGHFSSYQVSNVSQSDDMNDSILEPKSLWKNVFPSELSCIDMKSNSDIAVAACENGQIKLLNLQQEKIANSFQICDTCAINDIALLGSEKYIAVAGANPVNQVQIWDVTAKVNLPVMTFADSNPDAIYWCIENHPTRPELLLTGTGDGYACLWDRRKVQEGPIARKKVHQDAVRQMKFHPNSPNIFFSCGDDGYIRSLELHTSTSGPDQTFSESITSFSITHEIFKGTLACNCLDIDGLSNTLIAGSDSESVVVCHDIVDQNTESFRQIDPINVYGYISSSSTLSNFP